MKIIRYFLIAFMTFQLPLCMAQMSDEKVVEYVKSALKEGKTQEDIAIELASKGVTREQILKIRQEYETKPSTSVASQSIDKGIIRRKTREEVVGSNIKKDSVATTPVKIFGHDFFRSANLTFEPNENAATPMNYRLGPGDEVLVEVWGYNETSFSKTISPEGTVFIDQIGPVQLSGLTIDEASGKLTRLLSQKYAGIADEDHATSVRITLGQIRTITVNIMGEVPNPGTYRLSSFATVFTALYRCSGVTDNGSLRSIKVVRDGKEVGNVDIYGYLFRGKSETDISLKDGDIIIVPAYVSLVTADGKVKRPMKYELREGETLSSLIDYAGGFSGDAYTGDICVTRYNGLEKEVHTVKESETSKFAMQDGDEATVASILDRYANMAEIRGCVVRPGMYQVGGSIATVKQLVTAAGGLLEDAFTDRALIIREKENLELETVTLNLSAIMNGTGADVLLRKNDVLIVSSFNEIKDRGTLSIMGYVASPGEYPYSENTSIEDLILHSGGLLDGASMSRVDVARRISDANGMKASDTIAQVFSFPITEGLKIEGTSSFKLMPYDVVIVRKSPAYQVQEFVELAGEAVFPGAYAITSEGERLSSIIKRAGGLTDDADIDGVSIIRKSNEEDSFINETISKYVKTANSKDSLSMDRIELKEYQVAVDLAEAMENPGSDADIILKVGDRISVPKKNSIVRVAGEVMYPTGITYAEKEGFKYYINMAGGYTMNAKRKYTIVISPNGSAKRYSRADIRPGCVILVPSKTPGKKMTTAEIMSLSISATSLASSLTSLANILK